MKTEQELRNMLEQEKANLLVNETYMLAFKRHGNIKKSDECKQAFIKAEYRIELLKEILR